MEQENFEAWQYTCVSEQNQKICDLRELVFDSNTNEVVSYLSITINPDKLTQMQIAFPHAVNLKSPIKLQIDEKDPIDLNYAYCNQSACFVAEIIGENFVNFFANHGLLKIFNRPKWRTVSGGSKSYVEKILKLAQKYWKSSKWVVPKKKMKIFTKYHYFPLRFSHHGNIWSFRWYHHVGRFK